MRCAFKDLDLLGFATNVLHLLFSGRFSFVNREGVFQRKVQLCNLRNSPSDASHAHCFLKLYLTQVARQRSRSSV